MECPHCQIPILDMEHGESVTVLDTVLPYFCGRCLNTSLQVNGEIRKLYDEEMEGLKQSDCWKNSIEPLRLRIIAERKRAIH